MSIIQAMGKNRYGSLIKNELKTSCYKWDNYYLISNNYSIIRLNDNYDLKNTDKNSYIKYIIKLENK